jgi:hypothetical protein
VTRLRPRERIRMDTHDAMISAFPSQSIWLGFRVSVKSLSNAIYREKNCRISATPFYGHLDTQDPAPVVVLRNRAFNRGHRLEPIRRWRGWFRCISPVLSRMDTSSLMMSCSHRRDTSPYPVSSGRR